MGHTSALLITVAVAASTIAACGGSDDANDAPGETTAATSEIAASTTIEPSDDPPEGSVAGSETTVASTEPPATTVAATAPSTSAPATAPELTPEFLAWAERLIAAFDAHETEQQRLDGEVGTSLGALPADAVEQDAFDLLAEHHRRKADVTDQLVGAISEAPPESTPDSVVVAATSTVEALAALVPVRREFGDAFAGGDVEVVNQVAEAKDELLVAYEAQCAELQFQLLDRELGLVECGIQGEDPDELAFEPGPTIGDDDLAARIEAPAGNYTMTYLGSSPDGPPLVVGLESAGDLTVATSPSMIEVARGDALVRAYLDGTVADVTALGPDPIMSFWTIQSSPEGWINALPDVTIDEMGSGTVAGRDGTFWVLTSDRPDPVAILGDGEDWVEPETVLEPGESIRLWWVDVDGWPVLITEEVTGGSSLDAADAELAVLRDVLSIEAG